MIGHTVSHYQITRELGSGGMGVVYEAVDTKLDRTVALKFLPPESTRDHEAKLRFTREAKAASALDHPNICVIHEIDETNEDQMFLVMARYEGQTLKDRIARGPLPIGEALDIARQVAEGLAKAHERDIVHRDIKPANIFVTNDKLVKILDFGLAKLGGQTQMTREGATLGTVNYMSPELARGEEADRRTDLWCLGVVLYEMMTGQVPFQGENAQAVINGIVAMDPDPVTGIRTGVPLEMERIIGKCLEKKPGERYQHAEDLLADLRVLRRHTEEQHAATMITGAVPRKAPRRWPLIVGPLIAVLLVIAFGIQRITEPLGERRSALPRLVVLPFENVGASEDEYFADGMTDEITSKLAVLEGLAVISRSSAVTYKDTEKTLREIGDELDVDYVLEGTIRWDKREGRERIRITPRLIDVAGDTHVWAENYDRDIEDIFAVQADIAMQITSATGVVLVDAARDELETKPTENIAAYEAYLRGMDRLETAGRSRDWGDEVPLAIEMFERAIDLDAGFALCFAALSNAHTTLYHYYVDHRSEERLALAKAAAEEALRLDPDLPEAHVALARYHYIGVQDYDRALDELAVAEERMANNARINLVAGYILRRQGKFEESLARFMKAFEISPREFRLPWEIGHTLRYLRRYQEIEVYSAHLLTLVPDQLHGYVLKYYTALSWHADIQRAREALMEVPIESSWVNGRLCRLLYLERDYESILEFLSTDSVSGVNRIWWMADTYRAIGEQELALGFFDSLRIRYEKMVADRPDEVVAHRNLGWAYAGLGRKEDAIREGRLAVDLLPVSKDAYSGTAIVRTLATIYARVGEDDAALNEIEYLLRVPSECSVAEFRLDPDLDPLRSHPRFQKIMEKYANE